MTTVNFSVPEEVKKAFNNAFAHENKSAIIAGLMTRAVAEKKLQEQRKEAFTRIMARRKTLKAVPQEDVRRVRFEGRR